jgi:metal-dependent hydrolase (beta-lactamase superfamily II)
VKTVTCVVDNAVQRSSPFWGEHGLAFRIETDRGCFLFDKGKHKPIGLPLTQEELSQLAELRLSNAPAEVLPGVWTGGEIAERLEP